MISLPFWYPRPTAPPNDGVEAPDKSLRPAAFALPVEPIDQTHRKERIQGFFKALSRHYQELKGVFRVTVANLQRSLTPSDKRPVNGRFSLRSGCRAMMAGLEFGRDAMTTAMYALRKLVRSHHANPVHLDARTLRDIGLSRMTVEFAALR